MLLDPNEWPMSADKIAKLCGVSANTARRWIYKNNAPAAARKLIQLTQRQRIMPETWPYHWRINDADALDIGFTKIAFTPAQIEWYYFSCSLWYQLLALLPEIEARLDSLEKRVRGADVIDLAAYRAQLKTFKEREFLLRDDNRR